VLKQVACGLAGMQASPNAREPGNGGGGGPATSLEDAPRGSGLTHSGDTTHSDLSGACTLLCYANVDCGTLAAGICRMSVQRPEP